VLNYAFTKVEYNLNIDKKISNKKEVLFFCFLETKKIAFAS